MVFDERAIDLAIGRTLLRDAIIRTLEAAEIATIREIIVQAISKNFVKLISGK
ncbi:hypothetical protein [Microcoleus anatoxicus]|uniref:Uncharacterized protein n=1 Tax=Microcoleus anatoxicus PTRS2 TaxID=2705321 RepID=A0ABU8YHF6_9CYAN